MSEARTNFNYEYNSGSTSVDVRTYRGGAPDIGFHLSPSETAIKVKSLGKSERGHDLGRIMRVKSGKVELTVFVSDEQLCEMRDAINAALAPQIAEAAE